LLVLYAIIVWGVGFVIFAEEKMHFWYFYQKNSISEWFVANYLGKIAELFAGNYVRIGIADIGVAF